MVVMKIDELANSVRAINSSTDAYKYSSEIKVVYNSFTIVNIPYDAKNMFDCLFVNHDVEVPTYIKAQLTRIINKFLRTPIKDRSPEKKYRLMAMRYVEGPVAIKQYVTDLQASGDYMAFCFGSKENAVKWTDKELRNMSQWFPQKAIDAMKEPVEE